MCCQTSLLATINNKVPPHLLPRSTQHIPSLHTLPLVDPILISPDPRVICPLDLFLLERLFQILHPNLLHLNPSSSLIPQALQWRKARNMDFANLVYKVEM